MKKYLCFLLFVPILALAFYEESTELRNFRENNPEKYYYNVSFPLQAAVCDIIGIGHLHTQTTNHSVIKMDSLWYGALTNEYITINHSKRISFPSNNIPTVYFFLKHSTFTKLRPISVRFSYIFNIEEYRNKHEETEIKLFNLHNSWFPITPENEHLAWWCSNLVYYSQVQPDRIKYYEFLRDGYRLHTKNSRIHIDSYNTLENLHYFYSTNFIKQIAADTNLVGNARDIIHTLYNWDTGENFPPLNPFPQYVEPADDNHYQRQE